MYFPKKLLTALACSCLAATTIASSVTIFTPFAQAQSRKVKYNPPSNLDAPKTSSPGIIRGVCLKDTACLIGLLPDLKIDTTPVPQTISERPTIYFLVPKFEGQGTFRLYEREGNGRFIYRKDFELKNEAGIIAFKLPDDAPSLELGKAYRWRFDVNEKPDSKIVFGMIRRIAPSAKFVEQLKKVTNPTEKAALLAQESIWYDAVQTLAEAQMTVPRNTEVFAEWNALLQTSKLDRVLPFSFVSQKISPVE
ncbi:DUF928 domain-containing protein [Pseudanabaena sp. FACHB-1998]|uniref:DUF928 domain-containing protein n=1 Tax=Pseudanabaena sp. FACHB-1998 TaxID=2692858 RepID=UPI001680C47F|nr:DUF928 domain-containing protein [Pseudanabaena sp. FACHB-1998]MBD2176954.1 DUF928 domain-containing protein [Pseudanabaena sp. FACHB-1998]